MEEPASPVQLIAELRHKYERLLALRLQRDVLQAQGVTHLTGLAARRRKTEARQLAAAFPGALRQLDRLDAASIRARLAALEGSEGTAPRWAEIVAAHHQTLRWVLTVKRWLGAADPGGQGAEAAVRAQLARTPAFVSPPQTIDVSDVAAPRAGSLSALVARELQWRFDLSAADLDVVLYGAAPWEVDRDQPA